MAWAGISIDGKTDLHVIAGNLSGVRYALFGVSRSIWDELLVDRHAY
jgi:hypothetical protein